MKHNHYKIATQGNRITLYRRRLWILWFVVESRHYSYRQHAIDIIRHWHRKYNIKPS